MRNVTVTLFIEATAERIFEAFVNPEKLKEWWSVERALVERKTGGIFTLAWQISDQGFGYVSTGVVSTYIPYKELIISNFIYLNPERPILGPMSLTLQLKEVAGGTELYLCQDGYQDGEDWDWYYEAVTVAWPQLLNSFKEYMESD